MLKLNDNRVRKEKDSTVALINIVFLMLIFFLIAGTIVPPLDKEVKPVNALDEQSAELEGVLSIRANGQIYIGGAPSTLEAFVAERNSDLESGSSTVRILPDKELSAATLVDVINKLQASGVKLIKVVTERKERSK